MSPGSILTDANADGDSASTYRGVLLAGGDGTRLSPLTGAVSKQLLPVYNKPMVYYPLSVLMLAGLREVLVVTTPRHRALFEATLGDGSAWGMRFVFAEQPKPNGPAEALRLQPAFHDGYPVALVLGDNLIYGSGLRQTLRSAARRAEDGGAVIFGHPVRDPQRYGVVELDARGWPVSLEEKPASPRSDVAVPGLYFYDAEVTNLAAELQPSSRGEYEVTDLNRAYLERGELHVELWGRGTAWFDAGTPESLLEAQNFIHTLESRQGVMIGCPEEIAFLQGWIDRAALLRQANRYDNDYGRYLRALADNATSPRSDSVRNAS